MKITDYKLPKTVDARVRLTLQEMVQIINDGEYEQKTVTSAPTAATPGYEGETQVVVTGATMRVYKYASSKWWYSDLYTSL